MTARKDGNADAVAAAREAVDIFRQLSEDNEPRFAPDLAKSLRNLSNRLSEVGDSAGALAAIREAAKIGQELANSDLQRFGPDFQSSCVILAHCCKDAGDNVSAMAAFMRAEQVRRLLAGDNVGLMDVFKEFVLEDGEEGRATLKELGLEDN